MSNPCRTVRQVTKSKIAGLKARPSPWENRSEHGFTHLVGVHRKPPVRDNGGTRPRLDMLCQYLFVNITPFFKGKDSQTWTKLSLYELTVPHYTSKLFSLIFWGWLPRHWDAESLGPGPNIIDLVAGPPVPRGWPGVLLPPTRRRPRRAAPTPGPVPSDGAASVGSPWSLFPPPSCA